MYKDVNREEIIKWVKYWVNEKNNFPVLMIHYTADPEKDPDRDWEEWFKEERKSKPLHKWNKEYEIDFTTKSGQLIFGNQFCDFDPSIHFVESFPVQWELLFTLDFGQSNPNAWYVAIINKKWVIYIVDEYYKPAIPSVAAREMLVKFAPWMGSTGQEVMAMSLDRRRDLFSSTFQVAVVDPSTKSKNRTKVKMGEEIPFSVIEDFYDNWMDLQPGNNDWEAGITRLREYFMLDQDGKWKFIIFKDKCPNLCDEIETYKYKTQSEQQERVNNKSERPVKKKDHGIDAMRYLALSRPNRPSETEKELTFVQRDIQNLLKPQNIDIFWDND